MHVCLIVADQHVNVEGYSIADSVPMKGGQEIMSLDVDDITVVLHVQVTLQSRYGHSATAFSLSPGLTEVILFGGLTSLSLSVVIAETTVLRFG